MALEPLDPLECRVLGVLVEKAQTVPQQYPMTLNGVLSGCNQRNNRRPVLSADEDDVLAALDRLRGRGLVREVMLSGSRVPKFKHDAREVLGVGTAELVVLAELLLRGPQTVGELRSRASRMHPLESTEVVDAVLESLAGREEPLAKRIGRAPGGRADRWMQLLQPALHPIESDAGGHPPAGDAGEDAGGLAVHAAAMGTAAGSLATAADVAALEARVAGLEAVVRRLATALGEAVPELEAPASPPPAGEETGPAPPSGS